MHLLPVWAREERERGAPRQVGEPERVVPPPPHPAPHRTPLNWPAVPRIELGRPEWQGWLNFDRPGLADLPAGRPSIQIASLERGFVGEEPLSSRAVASGHPRPPHGGSGGGGDSWRQRRHRRHVAVAVGGWGRWRAAPAVGPSWPVRLCPVKGGCSQK